MTTEDIVTVRLRYSDLDMFVERFAPNVTRGGIFLATRQPRPTGSFIRFEVLLSRGQMALAGEGKVTWVREYDPTDPHKPHGMGVQFTRIDAETRPVLDRILRSKPAPARPGQPAPAGAAPRRPSGAFPTLEQSTRITATSQPTVVERSGRITLPVPVAEGAAVAGTAGAELPADMALDDGAYRKALERARALAADAGELEELLKPEPPVEAVSVAQAMAELPRLLQKPGEYQRRRTGSFRVLEPPPSSGGNGSSG